MVEIEIDGKKVEVPEGSMVMDAAHKLDVYVPHFCYHKKLSIAANCRMCLVEVEKAPKPLPACATPVTPGMIVRTHSEKAVKAQQAVMEFLLINHPLDCPICDQGGECQLQDLAVGYGGGSSRYKEEKRVVFYKNMGSLISSQEMSRCIHCTRCVRFGQEIAGVMELGMSGRGEHSEIMSFVGRSVNSEVSGNMIDICPVGALTSKPFRYAARTWELSRRKSVSPHDSLGSNLVVQVKQNKVMRVVPHENDEINECWLSDKDRFSYEALNSPERLTKPMIKQKNQWFEVSWEEALEYVTNGLKSIKAKSGAQSIGALLSPHATLEELHLAQKLMRGLGSENIDFRLRQTDLDADSKRQGAPWLGMPIVDVVKRDAVFVIGSFLRKDHPLLATQIRVAARNGLNVLRLHAIAEDWLMPIVSEAIVAPAYWQHVLAQVVVAVAKAKNASIPTALEGIEVGSAAQHLADQLLLAKSPALLLGNAAVQHGNSTQISALVQQLATLLENAAWGYLTEAANTVGAYLVNALPGKDGLSANQQLEQGRNAYVLLNVEPELDAANTACALKSLSAAEMVVMLSPFKAGMSYADVILPITPFTETSGSFVNCEGRLQSFQGVVSALGEARPAWKVLRVLGGLLGLTGFDYLSSDEIKKDVDISAAGIATKLNNHITVALEKPPTSLPDALERLADVPIYFSDVLVRHAPSLQETHDAQDPVASLPSSLADRLGLKTGDYVKLSQGNDTVLLPCVIDTLLADGCVRVPAAHQKTAGLATTFGAINVERAS